jgi:hypothetical protein
VLDYLWVARFADDRASLVRELVPSQGFDALFPVSPVELVEAKVRRLHPVETPDVDIDSIRVAPRTVERVNPTTALLAHRAQAERRISRY